MESGVVEGMSGVYIPNVQMPKDCTYCPCFNGISGWCNADESLIRPKDTFKRHPDCPLIPVPDHGRLIDADALQNDGWVLHKQVMRLGGYAIHEMPLNYPTIPTIIPADKEGNP